VNEEGALGVGGPFSAWAWVANGIDNAPRQPKGNETRRFLSLWKPFLPFFPRSGPTNRNHEDRVPATPPVHGRDARTVLAGKGSLRRAKTGAPLPTPRRSGGVADATGGSGGNTIQPEIYNHEGLSRRRQPSTPKQNLHCFCSEQNLLPLIHHLR